MAQLPTGTVTFLMTDVEGSTALWERSPEQMRSALARHDTLAQEIIARHAGHLVKSRGEGDSLFAVFSGAADGIAAAAELQRTITREPWPAETPIRIRIGVNTGEADLRDDDYYGRTVNRTARLRSVAHGGQVLVSQSTAQIVQDTLPPEISLRVLGQHQLRDLERPEQVFQLLHPDLPADFPPLRSQEVFRSNLPQQITSFIGREKEMKEVKRLLKTTRLLTLTGAGGAGKTRLTLQAGADLLDGFADGVWLVELAPLADPALVPQAVASALGVREEPGRTLVQTLTDYLQPKELLLLLDNCEHLLDACAHLIQSLLRHCARLKVVATSREGLNIDGETTYRIPSMSMPDPKEKATPESLSGYESVRLFEERAKAALPSFQITDQNASPVAQLCIRLDGIPLAIELAAARVKAMSVDQIAARLDDRFRLLTGGSRTALPRQQTLRAMIDWSYDLLSEKEQILLNRLSVFAGGWTLEAAEKVCADSVE